jgi:DNA-binding GntR family transcriptional regulator
LEEESRPGEKINIRKLTEELMVNAMAIREALRELEAEGMISFHSNRSCEKVTTTWPRRSWKSI